MQQHNHSRRNAAQQQQQSASMTMQRTRNVARLPSHRHYGVFNTLPSMKLLFCNACFLFFAAIFLAPSFSTSSPFAMALLRPSCNNSIPASWGLTCTQVVAQGQCSSAVAQGYCRNLCGVCSCNNNPPDNQYTCEQQKAFGKCGLYWMAGYCKYQRCTEPYCDASLFFFRFFSLFLPLACLVGYNYHRCFFRCSLSLSYRLFFSLTVYFLSLTECCGLGACTFFFYGSVSATRSFINIVKLLLVCVAVLSCVV